MESSIFKKAANFLKERKNNRRWTAVFLTLAAVVALGTVGVLTLTGHAQTYKVRELTCEAKDHVHTDECYSEDGKLVCKQPELILHTHNDDCYNDGGALVCTLEERIPHTHTDDCYEETRVLTCGLEEGGHIHTDECYSEEGGGELICEIEEHTHGDECYDENGELTCELEEHEHTEDCYSQPEMVLTCGLEESEPHEHSDECYTVDRELICQEPEYEEHEHTDDCYEAETVEVANEDGTVTEETRYVLTCGKPSAVIHTHDAGCITVEEMTKEEVEEQRVKRAKKADKGTNDEEQGDVSGDDQPDPSAEESGVDDESQGDVLNSNPTDSSAEEPGTGDETQADAPATERILICGKEEHTHTEACIGENLDYVCGKEEHSHTEECYENGINTMALGEDGINAIALNAEEPGDFGDFIVESVLTDQNDNVINPGDEVVVGDKYKFHVKFSEVQNGQQFSNPMQFKLPEGLKCWATSGDVKNGDETIGTYTVTEDGIYTVYFNENYVETHENTWVEADFNMTVVGTGDGNNLKLPWKDGNESTFNIEFAGEVDLRKSGGTYNPAERSIEYTLELDVTKGVVNNPLISDEMEKGMTYMDGSCEVTVLDENGNIVSLDPKPRFELNESTGKLELKGLPDPLIKGQKVTVKYKAQLGDGFVYEEGEDAYNFTVNNIADFAGTRPGDSEPVTDTADSEVPVSEKVVRKEGKAVGDEIDWEIEVGTGSSDIRGATVSDTLEGDHYIDTSKPLEVKWKVPGDDTIKTLSVPWSDPSIKTYTDDDGHIISFEYTIPGKDDTFWTEDGRKWTNGDWVKLEYYTKYDGKEGTFSNDADVTIGDQTWKASDAVGIGVNGVTKELESDDEANDYLHYKAEMQVPTDKLKRDPEADYPCFFVKDQLEFVDVPVYDENGKVLYYSRYFAVNTPEIEEITVTDLNGVDHTFVPYEKGEESKYFSTDEPEKPHTYLVVDKGNLKDEREFEIWFDPHLSDGSNTRSKASVWTLGNNCTLTIKYKVSTKGNVVFEEKTKQDDTWVATGRFIPMDWTIRDLINEGLKLRNNVAGYTDDNKLYDVDYDYKKPRNTYDVDKKGQKISDKVAEYSVRFNCFIYHPTIVNAWDAYEKVYIDPDGFYLEDFFDPRMEYVPGSLKVNLRRYDDDEIEDVYVYEGDLGLETVEKDGKEMGHLKAPASGFTKHTVINDEEKDNETLSDYMNHKEDGGTKEGRRMVYEFVYQMKLKDDSLLPGEAVIDNEALVHYGEKFSSDDSTITFEPDLVEKTAKPEVTASGDERNIIDYEIDLNPGGVNMVTITGEDGKVYDPENYTVKDIMSDNLTLDWDSIKVFYQKDNNWIEMKPTSVKEDVTPVSELYVKQIVKGSEEDAAEHLELVVPDNLHILIKYSASVDGIVGNNVSASNTVIVEADVEIGDSTLSEYTIQSVDSKGGASKGFRFFKRDSQKEENIGGAKFALYTEEKTESDSIEISDKKLYKQDNLVEPDSINGCVIHQSDGIPGDAYYVLIETDAPAGYEINDTPIVFKFGKSTSEPETVNVTVNEKIYENVKVLYFEDNETFTFDNTPIVYELPETGGDGYTKYIVGGLLVAMAAAFLIYIEYIRVERRRRRIRSSRKRRGM